MADYWTRKVSRRGAIAATGTAALGAAFLAACGGGSGSSGGTSNEIGASGGGGVDRKNKLDSATQGKRGGKLIWQSYGDPGAGLGLVKVRNAGNHQMAGLTHDGLYEYISGIQGNSGMDFGVQPNLAQALPEVSPDKLTFTIKLRPAKFHSGKAMTSEDVKYSFDRYAFGSDSAFKNDWPWLDSTQAPDASTIVLKAKYPY